MTTDTDAPTREPNSDSPGQRLARARQDGNIPVERIATELHLKPDRVRALEQDDYDRLPSPVFISGYIRAYARLVHIDPQQLIERFHQLHPNAEPPPARALAGQTREVGSSQLLMRLISLAMVVGVIGALAYWLNDGGWARLQQPTLTSPAIESDPVDTGQGQTSEGEASLGDADQSRGSAIDPGPTPDSTLDGPDAIAAHPGGASSAPASTPALGSTDDAGTEATATDAATTLSLGDETDPSADDDPPTGTVAGAPAPAPAVTSSEPMASDALASTSPAGPIGGDAATDDDAPGGGETVGAPQETHPIDVVISFTGPCWVDIRDADKQVELFGEMVAGDRHVLAGPPPYSMILGNAAAARVEVAGRPFDVNAIAEGNVARFSLDPEIAAADAHADRAPSPDAED